jgi:hypothetical protein
MRKTILLVCCSTIGLLSMAQEQGIELVDTVPKSPEPDSLKVKEYGGEVFQQNITLPVDHEFVYTGFIDHHWQYYRINGQPVLLTLGSKAMNFHKKKKRKQRRAYEIRKKE